MRDFRKSKVNSTFFLGIDSRWYACISAGYIVLKSRAQPFSKIPHYACVWAARCGNNRALAAKKVATEGPFRGEAEGTTLPYGQKKEETPRVDGAFPPWGPQR